MHSHWHYLNRAVWRSPRRRQLTGFGMSLTLGMKRQEIEQYDIPLR